MPYVNVRATRINIMKVQLAVDAITDLISEVLGKGTDTIMVDVEKAEELYLGKKPVDNGVVIQIFAFGESPADKKEEINTRIVEYLENKIGIDREYIYIIFTDKSEWGYKGMFLSK